MESLRFTSHANCSPQAGQDGLAPVLVQRGRQAILRRSVERRWALAPLQQPGVVSSEAPRVARRPGALPAVVEAARRVREQGRQRSLGAVRELGVVRALSQDRESSPKGAPWSLKPPQRTTRVGPSLGVHQEGRWEDILQAVWRASAGDHQPALAEVEEQAEVWAAALQPAALPARHSANEPRWTTKSWRAR